MAVLVTVVVVVAGGGVAYAAVVNTNSTTSAPLLPTVLRNQSGSLAFSAHLVPGRLDAGTFSLHASGTGTYNSFDHGVPLRLSGGSCEGGAAHAGAKARCVERGANRSSHGNVAVAHLQGIVQGELIPASTTRGPKAVTMRLDASIATNGSRGSVVLYVTKLADPEHATSGCVRAIFAGNSNGDDNDAGRVGASCLALRSSQIDSSDNSAPSPVSSTKAICAGLVSRYHLVVTPVPASSSSRVAHAALNALVQGAQSGNWETLYSLLAPELRTSIPTASQFAQALQHTSTATLQSAQITGKPIEGTAAGMPVVLWPVSITVSQPGGTTSTGSWNLELVSEGGQWWFYGTVPAG